MKNKDLAPSVEELKEQAEINELRKSIKTMETEKHFLEQRVTAVKGSSLEDQARALIGGQSFVDPDSLGVQIQQLDQVISVHQKALQMRLNRLSTLQSFRSRQICETVQGEHDVIDRENGRIAEALVVALEKEIAFVENLLDHDIAIGHLKRALPRGGIRNLIDLLQSYAQECSK
jgi:hypothetical protein